MSAQDEEYLSYRGNCYKLIACSDKDPFKPSQYGYKPIAIDTANMKGYLCEYEIASEKLLLKKLWINHADSVSFLNNKESPSLPPPPDLDGIKAKKNKKYGADWLFTGLNLALPFSGGIVIVNQNIVPRYYDMGYYDTWKYEEVHELIFEDGKLVSEEDVSRHIAIARQEIINEGGEKLSLDAEYEWLEQCFQKKYK